MAHPRFVLFLVQSNSYIVFPTLFAAENMVLEAYSLGIASCIIARGEETFENEIGQELLNKWDIPDTMIARCFVLLGYCEGVYPSIKERKEGRQLIITE